MARLTGHAHRKLRRAMALIEKKLKRLEVKIDFSRLLLTLGHTFNFNFLFFYYGF